MYLVMSTIVLSGMQQNGDIRYHKMEKFKSSIPNMHLSTVLVLHCSRTLNTTIKQQISSILILMMIITALMTRA